MKGERFYLELRRASGDVVEEWMLEMNERGELVVPEDITLHAGDTLYPGRPREPDDHDSRVLLLSRKPGGN